MIRPRSPFPARHRQPAVVSAPSWPPPRDVRRLAALLARPVPPCVLCGDKAAWRGLWRPTPECSQVLGAPAGKIRIVAYSLCRGCRALPDANTRAEERMLAEAAAALAMPESN